MFDCVLNLFVSAFVSHFDIRISNFATFRPRSAGPCEPAFHLLARPSRIIEMSERIAPVAAVVNDALCRPHSVIGRL